MNVCPAPKCRNATKNATSFCCSYHWREVPDYYRTRLAHAYFDQKHEIISLDELKRVEADIKKKLQWSAGGERATMALGKCNVCLAGCLYVYSPEEDRTVQLEEAAGGEFIVVAFRAVAHAGQRGAYTKFARHQCRPRQAWPATEGVSVGPLVGRA